MRCEMSCVKCRVSHVTCHMLLTPTARATDPPHANSPTMHSRMVCEYPKINFFCRQFLTNSEPKLQILRPLPFHYLYVRNLFIIDNFDLGPLLMRIMRISKNIQNMVRHTRYIVPHTLQLID